MEVDLSMYSQSQLAAALERFIGAESEAEQDAMCSEISRYVVDPGWMDLIFQSSEFVKPDGRVDTHAVACRILEYKPIRL